MNDGKLYQSFFLQFLGAQRHVGRTEIDGICFDLLDTAARTD